MVLEAYSKKRDFGRTPEPRPKRSRRSSRALTFVVQKHRASRLHFDFRLEAMGALKSWAVPKGPSRNPADKRLAIMVEDHPLEYAEFEGVIPEGEYGAGEVIVWDRGEYVPLVDDAPIVTRKEAERAVMDGIQLGKLSIYLYGERLRGRWTLVRKEGEDDLWLLIKKRDDSDEPHGDLQEQSFVLTSRTLADVKAGRASRKKPDPTGTLESLSGAKRSRVETIPLIPMLAALTDSAFDSADWVFEPKLDGMRVLAVVEPSSATLYSRRGHNVSELFPSLTRQLARAASVDMILDGEIVALDAEGVPSFQRLQRRINLTRPEEIRRKEQEIPIRYFVFDLIYADGFDLRNVPLLERRAALERFAPQGELVEIVAQFPEDGERTYRACLSHGFEGVIAKKRDSHYNQRRSRLWLKVKASKSDEFIIGGYTMGAGRRSGTFGALLLGQLDDSSMLEYAGHVGTGFDDAFLDNLLRKLESVKTDRSPFKSRPNLHATTYWVKPELVAEVRYLERTRDGILRAPVFKGLRYDKDPLEVRAPRLPESATY